MNEWNTYFSRNFKGHNFASCATLNPQPNQNDQPENDYNVQTAAERDLPSNNVDSDNIPQMS